MTQNSRTTLRPARHSDADLQLLDRLLSQFPELSHEQAADAAAGVVALPAVETAEPAAPTVATAPPRYHRA